MELILRDIRFVRKIQEARFLWYINDVHCQFSNGHLCVPIHDENGQFVLLLLLIVEVRVANVLNSCI